MRRMKVLTCTLLVTLLPGAQGAIAATPAAAPVALPATLEAALQNVGPGADGNWAFTMTTRVMKDGAALTTETVRVDPTKPQGQRCLVVAATDSEGKTKRDEVNKACKSENELPTYAWLARLLREAKVSTLRETADGAEFKVEPKPGSGIRLEGANFQISGDDIKDLAGTAHVTRTASGALYVDRLRLRMPQAAGSVLARVQKFEIDYHYAADPAGGAPLPTTFDMSALVRFIGLLDLDTRIEQRFSDVRRVTPR
jgi:hypothetical protein